MPEANVAASVKKIPAQVVKDNRHLIGVNMKDIDPVLGLGNFFMPPPAVTHSRRVTNLKVNDSKRNAGGIQGICGHPAGLPDAHFSPDIANQVDTIWMLFSSCRFTMGFCFYFGKV
ncbi:hypothetical protein Pmgp_02463 [Pelotomaculum propionicicum]|uniref:Uncharacterized protein n=1 Tax=Pelotomaculum propionicicum TaxID=258475 RepID=A0A4Y7RNF4_9FIRM|nr:hypothetical protein Pmgp_02463 [Pelotomaculum propionicicum]